MPTATIDGRKLTVIPECPYVVYSPGVGQESDLIADKFAALACLNATREARFPAQDWPNFKMGDEYYPWLFQATLTEEGWQYLLVRDA